MSEGNAVRACDVCGRVCRADDQLCPHCGAPLNAVALEPFAPISISLDTLEDNATPSPLVSVAPVELGAGFWKEALRDLLMPELESKKREVEETDAKSATPSKRDRDPIDEFEELYYEEDAEEKRDVENQTPSPAPVVEASSKVEPPVERASDEAPVESEMQDFVLHDFDAPPEIPKSVEIPGPAVELPDLEPQVNLAADPGAVKLPKWSEYDDRPKELKVTWHRLQRLYHAPQTRLVFSGTPIALLAFALVLELIFCFPCGYVAMKHMRRVYTDLAIQDLPDASEELKKAKKMLFIGAALILGVAVAIVGAYVAVQTDWESIQWVER